MSCRNAAHIIARSPISIYAYLYIARGTTGEVRYGPLPIVGAYNTDDGTEYHLFSEAEDKLYIATADHIDLVLSPKSQQLLEKVKEKLLIAIAANLTELTALLQLNIFDDIIRDDESVADLRKKVIDLTSYSGYKGAVEALLSTKAATPHNKAAITILRPAEYVDYLEKNNQLEDTITAMAIQDITKRKTRQADSLTDLLNMASSILNKSSRH